MTAIVQRKVETARRKARNAVVVAGASMLTYIFIWSWLGLAGLLAAGFLGYDWLRFRIKNGIRF